VHLNSGLDVDAWRRAPIINIGLSSKRNLELFIKMEMGKTGLVYGREALFYYM
jgi:hypothetical protein